MSHTLAYIRVSTDKQDVKNQRLEILEYARKHQLQVDEFIELNISSRKGTYQRRIDELVEKLQKADTLIVAEISRLGRSTAEVIGTINSLLKKGIRFIAIKQGMDTREQDISTKVMITMFSLLAELERDLISMRTREALAAKKAGGTKLGKPKGTVQKSKFDKDHDRIKELIDLGLSTRKISKLLGYSNHIGLNTYINRRNLRQ